MKRAATVTLVGLALAASACGGAMSSAGAPAAPPPASQTTPITEQQGAQQGGLPAYAQPPPPPPPPQPAATAAPPQDATKSSVANGLKLEGELSREEQDEANALATNNCAVACVALASMARATQSLCENARSESEGLMCRDARDRYAKAEARVRSSCGVCSSP